MLKKEKETVSETVEVPVGPSEKDYLLGLLKELQDMNITRISDLENRIASL